MTEHADGPREPVRRVLVVNPGAELGGAERILIDFIRSARAVEPSMSFRLCTFSPGPLLDAASSLSVSAQVIALPKHLSSLGDSNLVLAKHLGRTIKLLWRLCCSLPALLGFIFSLRGEISRSAPDIVHSNGIKAHMLTALACPKAIPLVWHMHDFLEERPFARRGLRFVVGRVSACIAVSEAVATETRRVFRSVPIVTIINAVDIQEFSPGPGDGPSLDRLSGLAAAPSNALRIGLVATYARWKGHEIFLRACARIVALLPHHALRFYIVGGPVYATEGSQFSVGELRALIAALGLDGSAGLVPFQDVMAPIFRSLDIVVHASTASEPFGRSIAEAMACARPVVVSAGGGVDELVRDGSTGLTHRPGDIAGLAEALKLLVDSGNLRASMADAGRRVVVSKFAASRLGPALLDLYASLVKRGRRYSHRPS